MRQTVAGKLSQGIEKHLQALGMANARFQIQVESGQELSANGCDKLAILFSANPGQEPRSIQKVASGGELSRIALAIKTVTANRDGSPASMVFDEIDTGISGIAAQIVGEKLSNILISSSLTL